MIWKTDMAKEAQIVNMAKFSLPSEELATEGVVSGYIIIIGAISSSSLRGARRGAHLLSQLPNNFAKEDKKKSHPKKINCP